jgi:hypothetical protein
VTVSAQAAVRDVAPWIEFWPASAYRRQGRALRNDRSARGAAAFGWGGGRANRYPGAMEAVHEAPFGRHILL